ncbi:hypothetical protein ASF66_21705 [Pseudomonas sp. Leaf129]|nr:hypothetical protein ASF66_21705 [Pseudomonas sp. Leaf129]
MTWLKDQRSRCRSEHCNAIATALLFEFTVNLRSWDNHFCDVRGYTIDGCAAMLEQICLMGFPYVNHAKTTVCTPVNTHTQIDLPAGKVEFWHVWNRAEAKTPVRVSHKHVFFEFEQF